MESISLESVKSFVDTLWVIDCAILVFIMQAGFMCMETGLWWSYFNINWIVFAFFKHHLLKDINLIIVSMLTNVCKINTSVRVLKSN